MSYIVCRISYVIHCMSYTVRRIVEDVLCMSYSELYVVQSTIRYTVYTIQYTLMICNEVPKAISTILTSSVKLTVKSTLYCVHCTLCSVQYTPYSVQCTLYCAHYILYSVTLYYTVYIVLRNCIYDITCTLYIIHCTVYSVECILYVVQCTMCCV